MKSIKSALGRSIETEEKALDARFERADALLDDERKKLSRTAPSERVIRDSFTLPSADYQLIGELRTRCLQSATNATKSEIIRAGLHALQNMTNEDFLRVLQSLPKVKTGRPVNTV